MAGEISFLAQLSRISGSQTFFTLAGSLDRTGFPLGLILVNSFSLLRFIARVAGTLLDA